MTEERARPAAAGSSFVALVVGAKPVNALLAHGHVGSLASALFCGVVAALAFFAMSRAFGARPRAWEPASIGLICAVLVLALRALA